MKVSLIRVTQAPEELAGSAAAMCYNGRNPIKSLQTAMKNGHVSVTEHAAFTFKVEGVSRALLAQLTRHRLASFSVQSQRYVAYTEGFEYVTPPRIKELGEEAEKRYKAQMATMARWYAGWLDELGKDGAEDARFVLPNGCCTTLIVTMNARELMHFFELRCCARAQWEIREMARRMALAVKEQAPVMFEKAGAYCVQHGYCPEGANSCGKAPTLDKLLKVYKKERECEDEKTQQ